MDASSRTEGLSRRLQASLIVADHAPSAPTGASLFPTLTEPVQHTDSVFDRRLCGIPADEARFLDLSKFEPRLSTVPKRTLSCRRLKALYLESNALLSIPDTLFEALPELTHLDLRSNRLTSLPASVGQHNRLQTLLLQKNRITDLPVELGRVRSLSALSLSDNPLRFPNDDIIRRGCLAIKDFLKSHDTEARLTEVSTTPPQMSTGPSRVTSPSRRVPALQQIRLAKRETSRSWGPPPVPVCLVHPQHRPPPKKPIDFGSYRKAGRVAKRRLVKSARVPKPKSTKSDTLGTASDSKYETESTIGRTFRPKTAPAPIKAQQSIKRQSVEVGNYGIAKHLRHEGRLTEDVKVAVRAASARHRASLDAYKAQARASSAMQRRLLQSKPL